MITLHSPRANLRLRLSATLSPDLAELCTLELDHFADCLAPWGRFLRPVRVASAASMSALIEGASAPVDGSLCAIAELDRITLLAPAAWSTTPGRLQLRTTLTHELAHCLLFQRCAPPGREGPVALPTWFREGMALVASEGAPTREVRRRLGAELGDATLELHKLADADAALIGQHAAACYDAAALLFARWYHGFGQRRLGALCRHMRTGHPFAVAFRMACGLSSEAWLAQAVTDLRAELTDQA